MSRGPLVKGKLPSVIDKEPAAASALFFTVPWRKPSSLDSPSRSISKGLRPKWDRLGLLARKLEGYLSACDSPDWFFSRCMVNVAIGQPAHESFSYRVQILMNKNEA